ncbi:MAG TPA: DUF2461 domain-containing protein [Kofleriaceae bacterium]|nr:DUF2461 domain-containing protein [Kofleriaceae bacterium]
MKTTVALPTKFTGYDRNAMAFWHELAMEMNRDWFLANKARYQSLWVAPTEALLAAAHTSLAPLYKPMALSEPKIMRVNRDVRFSKDKAPYKTHIGSVITLAGKNVGNGGCAALYFHVGIDEDMVGAGTYFFDAAQLAKWRKAVVGKAGAELVPVVTKLRKAGFTVGGHDDYKKVPKGLAPEHPRADLLKQRGMTAMFPAIPRGLLHEAKLLPWIVKQATAVVPLVQWLHKHVG